MKTSLGTLVSVLVVLLCACSANDVSASDGGVVMSSNGSADTSQTVDRRGTDVDGLKGDVIKKIVRERNMSASDVVNVDVRITPTSDSDHPDSYRVTGSFRLETDQPINIGDAVALRAQTNFCNASRNGCTPEQLKIKHTVYFDATAESTKAHDGNRNLKIDYQISIDRPLENQDERRAIDAYSRRDYPSAFRFAQVAAQAGSARAQYILGILYADGDGVPQDYVSAAAWYRRAAEQGHPTAQTDLGMLYVLGHGVPQSYSQARIWFEKGAAGGNTDAEHNLGVMYEEGDGVPQDYAEAAAWYKRAADHGHVASRTKLADLQKKISRSSSPSSRP